MKRLASIVAFALLVPLTASASTEGAKPGHATAEKSAPKPHVAGKAAHKPAAPAKTTKAAKADRRQAPARHGQDVGHHEPSVTHGVLVAKVSARHVEHPAPAAKAGHGHAKKELPLLPAAAVERIDPKELGDKSDRPSKKAHEGKPEVKSPAKAEKAEKAEKAPEKAAPKPHKKDAHKAELVAPKPVARAACLHDAVEVVRGAEVDRFALQRCEGGLAPLALERLSVALRPSQVARPVLDLRSAGKPESLAKAKTAKNEKNEPKVDVLPAQIKRVDPGLAERLDLIATHFHKPGQTLRVGVVSGYRPSSVGSQHSHGRAMDIRVEGVDNEALVAFCKSIPDTGCGYYPNSSFVHVDVRDPGAGHVSWIDASGPGETPRYVTEWPLKSARPEVAVPAAQADDEHPATGECDKAAKAGNKAEDTDKPIKPQEMIDGVKD